MGLYLKELKGMDVMIKVSPVKADFNEPEINFPKLMINKRGSICLILGVKDSNFTGVCLTRTPEYSEYWAKDEFSDYEGGLLISNKR